MKAHSTKKTYPNSEVKELQQVLEAVNSCNKRIDNLETITANLDKNLTNSVFDCRVVNNMVCELKSELFTSIDSKLKHQLSVMREDQNNFKNEMEEKLKKAEAEVKRLQGRVGSLVEEKTNLLKRIKSLENDNKTFKDEVSSLNTATKVNHNDDINTNPTLIQCENSVVDPTKVANPDAAANNPPNITAAENPDTETTNVKILDNGNATNHDEYDFVMLCDSNRKFLNISKLCSSGHSKIIPCNTTKKAKEILESPRFDVKKGIIINTGVNDLEHLSAGEIVKSQVQMANMAVKKFPGRQIFLCGITPRGDKLDRKIPDINDDIHEEIKDIPNVSHIYNGNLRNGKLYFDVKHLNRRFGIPALAKNIKNELRKIFGGNRKENTSTQQRSVPSNQNQEGSQHTNAGQVQNFDKELGSRVTGRSRKIRRMQYFYQR